MLTHPPPEHITHPTKSPKRQSSIPVHLYPSPSTPSTNSHALPEPTLSTFPAPKHNQQPFHPPKLPHYPQVHFIHSQLWQWSSSAYLGVFLAWHTQQPWPAWWPVVDSSCSWPLWCQLAWVCWGPPPPLLMWKGCDWMGIIKKRWINSLCCNGIYFTASVDMEWNWWVWVGELIFFSVMKSIPLPLLMWNETGGCEEVDWHSFL